MEEKRLVVQVEGGVMVEDDGGFMNFVSTRSVSPGDFAMGIGYFGGDEEESVEPEEGPAPDNLVEVDFLNKRRK